MAHPNIDARRAHVLSLLERQVEIDGAARRLLASQFQCSPSAIRADVLHLERERGLPTPHVSHQLRTLVRERDEGQCQYCQTSSETSLIIIEHVVPASRGGVARAYNLVVACASCNSRKRDAIWIPRNLGVITERQLAWRARIVREADANPTGVNVTELIIPTGDDQSPHRATRIDDAPPARAEVRGLLLQAARVCTDNAEAFGSEFITQLAALVTALSDLEVRRGNAA